MGEAAYSAFANVFFNHRDHGDLGAKVSVIFAFSVVKKTDAGELSEDECSPSSATRTNEGFPFTPEGLHRRPRCPLHRPSVH